MAIKKHEEIRLNVKPIFLTLYHEYVFEGPCRFGEGIQLEKEFDLHMAAEKFKGWYAQLQAAMPENVVNLLEPVKVERDENFLTKDEMIDKLAEGSEEVDLYFIGYASRPYDLALEFAQRVGKPCAITQACCASAITSAEFLAGLGGRHRVHDRPACSQGHEGLEDPRRDPHDEHRLGERARLDHRPREDH